MAGSKAVADSEAKMKKAVDFFHDELRSVRTGRASTGLVEPIRVDYYGNPTPIKALATLSTPQADQIIIKPFDPASIKDIEKAIKNSDLSISPIVDGKVIRLTIPPLSGERRKQLVNQVKQMGEQSKITVRNIRRDAIKHMEDEEKAGTITEDDKYSAENEINKIISDYNKKVEETLNDKEKEIKSI
jgi:ribosome recycling factor